MANVRERAGSQDRVLIVESDPAVTDLIGRQALAAYGYQVQVAADANTAMAKALQWAPDLIIANLHLPGLSGKDLLVALASQGIQTPLIVLAQRGMEADLIQTFRLGAADYIFLPAREAEVINAVNRVFQQIRDRRERDKLAQQLQQTNQELQARVRELTTIFALGKAMTSVTDQSTLLERVLDAAVRITRADLGWFLLRDDAKHPFLVAAAHKVPASMGVRLNRPWDDGISSLVALSGEALSIHGEPLKRFKIAALGLAALIVPIRVQKNVAGLLVMMRHKEVPFGASEQHLLGALADYASISLVNARLFQDAAGRARSLQVMVESAQMSDKVKGDILRLMKKETSGPLHAAQAALDSLAHDPLARWRPEQRQQLNAAQEAVLHAREIVDAVSPEHLPKSVLERGPVNLLEFARASLRRLQPYAQRSGVRIITEFSAEEVVVTGDSNLLAHVYDAVLSNAIKFAGAGGQAVLHIEKTPDNQAHIILHDSGPRLEPERIENIFSAKAVPVNLKTKSSSQAVRFGGLGIRLHLVKDIVLRHNGVIWMEAARNSGNNLHICLPLAR